MGEGAERSVGFCRTLVEQRQQLLGRTQVADSDQRLDRDRACKLGMDLVHLLGVFEIRCNPTPAGARIVRGSAKIARDSRLGPPSIWRWSSIARSRRSRWIRPVRKNAHIATKFRLAASSSGSATSSASSSAAAAY